MQRLSLLTSSILCSYFYPLSVNEVFSALHSMNSVAALHLAGLFVFVIASLSGQYSASKRIGNGYSVQPYSLRYLRLTTTRSAYGIPRLCQRLCRPQASDNVEHAGVQYNSVVDLKHATSYTATLVYYPPQM